MSLRPIICALLACVAAPAAGQVPVAPPSPAAPTSPTAPPSRDVGSAPASTEEIVAAAQDCVAAVTPGRFERETFRARGWIMAGPPTTREIRPGMASQQAMFGRQGGQVLSIINVTGGLLVHCTIVARISDVAQHAATRSALIAALALTPSTDGIVEERDRQFAQTVDEGDRGNLLLNRGHRLTVRLQDAPAGPAVRIEIFPKRPLET